MKRSVLHRVASNGGYTLIEVVIALSVFAVLALSMSASVATAMQANSRARDRDNSRSEAASKIEEIIAWPDFNTLLTEFNGDAFSVPGLETTSGALPGLITVTQETPEMLRIDVSVTWFDASLVGIKADGTQSFEVNTRITDRSSL
jgi:prepilin-type N-terminal cleavage/methylation domain-containing protein